MNTKNAIVILLISFSAALEARCQNEYVVPRREITSPGLINAINDYYIEFKDDLDASKGAVIIRYLRSDADKFYFAYKVYKEEVMNDRPLFYSMVNGKLVLFYTGIEQYLRFDYKSLDQLFIDGKGFLSETGILYSPIIWEVVLDDNNKYNKKIVDELPW